MDENGIKKMGGKELIQSAKYFHPEISFIRITDEQRAKALKSVPTYNLIAHFGKFFSVQFDLVIHIGLDSLLLDKIDEALVPDYDVGGVLNNNAFDLKVSVLNITDKYINAHFVSSWRPEFWWHWDRVNQKYGLQNQYGEQDTLNIIFHYGNYRTKIFDETKNYWGIKARGQWQSFVKKEDGIYLNDEKVKVFHYAGGDIAVKNNYEEMFPKEVAEYIREVTK
jgi:hypothetical protein